MGSFFSNLIVERGAPETLRDDIACILKPQGYAPVADGADADITIFVLGGAEDQFWVLVGEGLEELLLEFAQKLAKRSKRRVIAAQCIDSDVLLLSLTKGGASNDVCIGDPEAYDIEPRPFRSAPWMELVGPENWDAFRAARKRKYVYAEDALSEIEGFIGFRAENAVLTADDLEDAAEPLFAIAFRKVHVIPVFLPQELPPAFRPWQGTGGYCNPVRTVFMEAGGIGCGYELHIVARGFDAGACEIGNVWITRHISTPKVRMARGMPVRCTFADGSAGWKALFPDEDISPGLNLRNPERKTLKGIDRELALRYAVEFVLRGGAFPPRGEKKELHDGASTYVEISLIPLENPAGAATNRVGICRADKVTNDAECMLEHRWWMLKERSK